MAEVVRRSTQHLDAGDLRAIAVYLKSLPAPPPPERGAFAPDTPRAAQGGRLYADHCAGCHGKAGDGGRTAGGRDVVPALAGNRLVAMEPPVNLVRVIQRGGFGAGTAHDPRPFGMPPFGHALTDEQIAAIATFLRTAWGAQAAPVTAFDVARWRGGPDD
jgi:mono/diheme cytochrome c family protein